MFKGDISIPETLSASDLGSMPPVFWVDTVHHVLDVNFDPESVTTVTDKETALVFTSTATDSALEGIGVRKYAGNDSNASDLAAHQDTAVYAGDATGVVLRDDFFSFNSVPRREDPGQCSTRADAGGGRSRAHRRLHVRP